jgi:hypothetical protein
MSYSDVKEKGARVPLVISPNIGTPVQREHDGNAHENSSFAVRLLSCTLNVIFQLVRVSNFQTKVER